MPGFSTGRGSRGSPAGSMGCSPSSKRPQRDVRTTSPSTALRRAGVPVLAPVFRHCDTVESPWLRAQAAVLSGYPDRVVSHHTAAALWQLTIAESQDLHTIRRNGLGQPSAGASPATGGLPEKTVIGGLPVTKRHRTMIDLLCSCGHPDNVDWLVSEFRAGRLDQGI